MKTMNTFDRRISQKDKSSYAIMMKDNRVCDINIGTGIVTMYSENLLPLDLYLEWDNQQDTLNNLVSFQWWCANRILSLDREYAKEILNSCGLKQATTDKDKASIALKYKCLSLRDFYWVQKISEHNRWCDISLFTNSLSNAVVDLALRGENLTVTNKKLIDSDLATDGTFPKAWIRYNDTFWLLKGDKNDSVNKEVYASLYLRKLGFDVLEYNKHVYKNEIVSVSRCFTNPDVGYITAGNLVQNYDLNLDFRQYDMMLLCDFLVGNADRHQDNWGYLFDDKRKIINFAPIFDFNHAFEAPESFYSLPDMLINRKRTMLDAAKEVVNKYKIDIMYLEESDKYAEFINERISLLTD